MDLKEYEIMYRSEQSHWWYQGMAAITRSLIRGLGIEGSGLRILDAGCGTGAGLMFLAQYGLVTGIDISGHALRFCAARGRRELARASVMALPFRERIFDLVTSLDILYFRGIHDRTALKEAKRVLRPGGRLLIRVPAFDWLRGIHDMRVSTAHRYTSRELANKLASIGFEVEYIGYANMFLFPFAVFKRFFEKSLFSHKGCDLEVDVGILSGLLKHCLVLESRLIPKWCLPFGLSVVAVGRKLSGGSPENR